MMQMLITTATRGAEDLTARVSAWSFDTRVGVGFATARISISAPQRDLWYLLNAGSEDLVEFRYAGVLVWQGYFAGATRRGTQLELTAEGPGMRLNDTEVWRVFADAGYSAWESALAEDSAFNADNNNRVYVGAPSGTYTTGDEGTVVYPDDLTVLGAGIVRVEAHALVTLTSGAWVAELRTDAGGVLWSSSVDADTDIAVTVAEADGLVWALRATGTGSGAAEARLTQVIVRTLYPGTNSTIISALLTAAGSAADQVADTGLAVDRAFWQGVGHGTALREMAELGDGAAAWRFTMYEQERFGAWPEAATWLLVAGEGDVEIGYQRDAVFNAVRARLPDGYMTDWLMDAASIARWGRREKTLELQQTSQAEAARLAAVYLADYAWPVAGLRIAAGAVIRAADGSLWPAWRVRAGQVLTLRDVFPYRDVDIRIAETQATPSGVSLTPQGATNRLEVLLAAQERRLRRATV